MGSSPSAKLAWGIDLGDEESWYEGEKYAALARFGENEDDGPGSFSDWDYDVRPGLYIDKAARDAALDALAERREEMRDAGRSAEYVALRAEINAAGPVPVTVEHYGYEFRSHALILARSYVWAYDWGSCVVDPASLFPPSPSEIGYLKTAVESLGLTFDPADVSLILMSQYG